MRAWAAAIRIARREARKSKGRSALVLAMIGLPVAVLSFAAVTFDMFQLTESESLDRRLGRADAALTYVADGPIKQGAVAQDWFPLAETESSSFAESDSPTAAQVLAALPPDSRVIPLARSGLRVRGPGGITYLSTQVVDISDPMTRGIGELTAGRAAAGDGEIVINAEAARELNASIGSTVRATAPDRDYLVVGMVEFPDQLSPLAVTNSAKLLATADRPIRWLADTPAPLTWDQVGQLNTRGISVDARGISRDTSRTLFFPSAQDVAIGFLASGMVALEVILLAGPAFAVSARRRARDLALIAAAGGAPKHLRRVVLADGVVLGAGGAAAGILLGVSLALLTRPMLEESIFHTRAGAWRVFPVALIAIAALAVGTGLLAAMVPAFIAARQDVVHVLNGRRGVLRSRRRWIATGLVMVTAGALIAVPGAMSASELLMLLGIVLAELGLVVLTPGLVGLIAKLGRWLPLSARLALRDTARNRTAAAPAISAIMAAVAGAVAVGVFFGGLQRQQAATYQPYLPPGSFIVHADYFPPEPAPDWAVIETTVREVLPTAALHTYSVPVCPGDELMKGWCEIAVVLPEENLCPYTTHMRELTPSEMRAAKEDHRCGDLRDGGYSTEGWIGGAMVDNGDVLPMLSEASESDIAAAKRTLAGGGVVVTDWRMIRNGEVTLTRIVGQEPLLSEELITVPGYLLVTGTTSTRSVVPPAVAARLGVSVQPRAMAGMADTIPSVETENLLQGRLAEIGLGAYVSIERGIPSADDPTALILALAAALIALGAAGIATGLATVDGRADLATLAAVGAGPAMRRRLSLSRAGVIAGLGALLGTAAGLGGAGVMIAALNQVYAEQWPIRELIPFTFPWQSLAIIVAVPIVAMAGAALFTRAGLPIERRF